MPNTSNKYTTIRNTVTNIVGRKAFPVELIKVLKDYIRKNTDDLSFEIDSEVDEEEIKEKIKRLKEELKSI